MNCLYTPQFLKNQNPSQFIRKGFTLMELVIVIAVIGIMAAITVPSVTHFFREKNFSTDQQTIQNTFSQGFSFARNEGTPITILANSQKFLIKKNGETEEIALVSGGTFARDFRLTFSPPFGDVSEATADQIKYQTEDNSFTLKIHKKSGLIEKIK